MIRHLRVLLTHRRNESTSTIIMLISTMCIKSVFKASSAYDATFIWGYGEDRVTLAYGWVQDRHINQNVLMVLMDGTDCRNVTTEYMLMHVDPTFCGLTTSNWLAARGVTTGLVS